MPNSEVLLYSRSKFNATAILYKLAVCTVLQNDINVLNRWCQLNKMKFHPEKCSVISIFSNIKDLLYLNPLPMSQYRYHLGNDILNYEKCEKDLGIIVNSNFSWLDHQSLVTSKASQMLGSD